MPGLSRRTILASALVPIAVRARAQDKVTLTLWHQHPEWKDRVVAILNRFEAEHPNIHVDLQEMPSPVYVPRMNTALAAGEAPDIIAINAGPDLAAAGRAGYMIDLTGKLDVSSLTPAGLAASKSGDKMFGVPIMGYFTVALYYNRDIFDRQKLTPPKTWDEFFDTSKALKAKGISPVICPAQDGIIPAYTYMLAATGILGVDGFAALRRGERKLTDPDVLKAAEFLRDTYAYVQPGAIGTGYTEGKALFALGRGAMMEAGSADYSGFTQTNPKVNFGVVPFPAPPGGKPSTVTGMQGMFGINGKCKHMQEAVTFMQWMLGREPAQMVVDTITLSTSREVAPKDNRVMQEMMAASQINDVPVWFQFAEVGKVYSTVAQRSQALFLGELSPADFAKALQDTIVPAAT
ncbi:MAG: extracellular solute-binding protein [Acidisphaera sp.]|nr:extracellular solute-binding protein [Acidisphaera sp.]